MMRTPLSFLCAGHRMAATLDRPDAGVALHETGLMIVSGGNEIRAGAHGGQAMLAAWAAARGHAVLRYDRRGVGESEGDNHGFLSSGPDIAAAAAAFRAAVPGMTRILALGNCDAASALALYGAVAGIDALVLANPWTFDNAAEEGSGANASPVPSPALGHSPAAIRARYWRRLKQPGRLARDLVMGRIAIAPLRHGLRRALRDLGPDAGHVAPSTRLASDMAAALAQGGLPTRILLAERDRTAQAFMDEWKKPAFAPARAAGIALHRCPTASHSFTGEAQAWLRAQLADALDCGGLA